MSTGVVTVTDLSVARGVGSRALLSDRLREEVARAMRYRLPLACLVFEVEASDKLSDAAAGSLTHAATVLARGMVRESDVVASLSGRRFGVVANTGGEDARSLAETVARQLEGFSFLCAGRPLGIEVRYGVSSLDEGKRPGDLLEEARTALQRRCATAQVRGQS